MIQLETPCTRFRRLCAPADAQTLSHLLSPRQQGDGPRFAKVIAGTQCSRAGAA